MQHLFNSTKSPEKKRSSGFTLVELLVVISILGGLMFTVLFTLGDFYTSNTTSLGRSTQETDTRGVLRSIEGELANSAGFSSSLLVLAPPLGSDNLIAPWSYCGSSCSQTPTDPSTESRVLIANAYATDKPVTDDSRMPIFDAATGCDPASATALKNSFIYFIAPDPTVAGQKNLYRRTINPTQIPCAGTTIAQKQTCASGRTNGLNCRSTDALLLYDVSAFTVNYYTTPSDPDTTTIANQYYSGSNLTTLNQVANDVALAKSIKITVTTNQFIDGKKVPSTASIRISRSY